jgi:hypothetical protein
MLYGKLYSGDSEEEILTTVRADLKRLTVQEQWEGQQGEEFREKENWILIPHKDGTESWGFDADKYTNYLGFGMIVDQFVESCWFPPIRFAILNRWVPLRLSDCNNQDYIISKAFYDSINEADPDALRWILLYNPDDLPF